MEELALRIPSSDMNFVSELATRMGWVLTKLGYWTGITTSDDKVVMPKQKKIKLPKGNGKTTQEALEWIKSLAIKGRKPVPADEDGRDCRTEKYL